MNRVDLKEDKQKGGSAKGFSNKLPKLVASHMKFLAVIVLGLDILSKIILHKEICPFLAYFIESLTTISWSLLVATYSIVYSNTTSIDK